MQTVQPGGATVYGDFMCFTLWQHYRSIPDTVSLQWIILTLDHTVVYDFCKHYFAHCIVFLWQVLSPITSTAVAVDVRAGGVSLSSMFSVYVDVITYACPTWNGPGRAHRLTVVGWWEEPLSTAPSSSHELAAKITCFGIAHHASCSHNGSIANSQVVCRHIGRWPLSKQHKKVFCPQRHDASIVRRMRVPDCYTILVRVVWNSLFTSFVQSLQPFNMNI